MGLGDGAIRAVPPPKKKESKTNIGDGSKYITEMQLTHVGCA